MLKTYPPRMMSWKETGLLQPLAGPQVIAADAVYHNVQKVTSGNIQLVFTKKYADTDLAIQIQGTAFSPNTGWAAIFGVNVNGVDLDCAMLFINAASTHMTWAGGNKATGLAPGTYTITLRFKSSAVAVANINLDAGDRWRIFCEEGWS